MVQEGSSVVDPIAVTATLELYASGALVTSYDYTGASSQFILSARPAPLDITKAEFKINLAHIVGWWELLRSELPRAPMEWCAYKLDTEEDAESVKLSLKCGEAKLIDAKYKREDMTLKFKERQQAILMPKQFWHFVQALKQMQKLIG